MEEFLVGLALAAISAITYLAYAHPVGYAKVVVPIILVVLTVMGGLLIWDVSSKQTLAALSDYIPPESMPKAIEVADGMQTGWFWVFVTAAVVIFYLRVLIHLPLITGKKGSKD